MKTEPLDMPLEFVRECVQLGRAWRSKLDELLKPSGLTMARATVLYWVNELPPGSSQRELADVVGIEGPTLVRLLHALEAQGVIERVASTSDRRAKGIRLTAKAEPLLAEVMRVSAKASHDLFDGLDRRRLPAATRLAQEAQAMIERG